MSSHISALSTYILLPVPGSLSEDAPPPSRGMAMGQAAYSSRHAHPMALARSLPVSVPVWGCRGNRSAQGEGNSAERVSAYQLSRRTELHVCMQRLLCITQCRANSVEAGNRRSKSYVSSKRVSISLVHNSAFIMPMHDSLMKELIL